MEGIVPAVSSELVYEFIGLVNELITRYPDADNIPLVRLRSLIDLFEGILRDFARSFYGNFDQEQSNTHIVAITTTSTSSSQQALHRIPSIYMSDERVQDGVDGLLDLFAVPVAASDVRIADNQSGLEAAQFRRFMDIQRVCYTIYFPHMHAIMSRVCMHDIDNLLHVSLIIMTLVYRLYSTSTSAFASHYTKPCPPSANPAVSNIQCYSPVVSYQV